MQVDFLGPTYMGRSKAIDASRCINFYPELNPNPDAKSMLSLVGTPGSTLFLNCGTGPIRAMHEYAGDLYVVSGSRLYMCSSDGHATVVGNLHSDIGPVQMEDNGVLGASVGGGQLALVDGSRMYIACGGAFTQPTLPFTHPATITFLDGYFIATNGSMAYWVCDLFNGNVWRALASASAMTSPDNIRLAIAYKQQLYLAKGGNTEVWYDAGTSTTLGTPFRRVQGVPLDYGIAAVHSAAQSGDSLYMLANIRGRRGSEFIGPVQVVGYNVQPIAPPAIIHRIQSLGYEDAIGYCYSMSGHDFYVLTLPYGNATFVFDRATQMWHEWSTYNPAVDRRNPGRHMSNCYCNWAGRHLVGDYRNGNVYELSNLCYGDNGQPIISSRIAPLAYDKMDFSDIFFARLYIVAEVGTMDPANLTSPHATLSWSQDGGYTWSSEYPASLGLQGEYMTRLVWRRVGYSYDQLMDVTISDPVRKVLVGAYADLTL